MRRGGRAGRLPAVVAGVSALAAVTGLSLASPAVADQSTAAPLRSAPVVTSAPVVHRTYIAAAPGSTVVAVPATTLAPIKGKLPPPPSTVPFVTRATSAHVDPILAKISLAGLALALLIMAVQFVLTRPGRHGPTL